MQRFSYLIVFLCLALPTDVCAQDSNWIMRPYGGIDYQHTGINYAAIPNTTFNYGDFANESLHGINVHVGMRLHKYFGAEGSYTWTNDAEKSNLGVNTKVYMSGWAIDGMGYLPVMEKVELIGTAGLSLLTASLNIAVPGASVGGNKEEIGGRFGGGAQYWIAEHINARALVRYQTANFGDVVDNAILANIGLNYQF